MRSLISFSLLFCSVVLFAQNSNKEKDIEAIKAMTGCYRVTFDYAETFAADTNYQKKDNYHAAAPAEYVFVAEETDDKIVLQHILVMNDTTIIKHWRQDWIYENQDLFAFDKNKAWSYVELDANEVDGEWTQKVYQVDDGPRYEGTAPWVHVDGKHYWESVTDAPLPRREFSKRSDYNVMERTNRHEITNYGWMHEQDNKKIIRQASQDELLVEEKGYNRYIKIDEEQCDAGKDWWEKNGDYWAIVRSEWDKLFAQKEDINFKSSVDGKKMWEQLFALNKEAGKPNKKTAKEVREIINAYLVDNELTGSK